MSDSSSAGPQSCFITFEGGEGSGKTTQVKLLGGVLKQIVPVVMTREPGGCPQAEEIRNLVLSGTPDRWDGVSEALLMYAARRVHVREVIWPAMQRGDWVLCDRFADSSMAYQGYAQGVGRSQIEQLHQLALGNFQPDLTLIFDLPVEVGLQRAQQQQRFEQFDEAFHQSIRDGFLDIARREPQRCVVIDAAASLQQVHNAVIQVIENRFGLKLQG